MNTGITYEQPFNERVRSFLRIEHLFDCTDYHSAQASAWGSRQSITTMLDIIDLLSRFDVKSELVKDLGRHATALADMERNPEVDRKRLDLILLDVNHYLNLLRDSHCQPGLALRQNELLSSVRQRNTIQGGACSFDLPNYHYWLNRPCTEQKKLLDAWRDDLSVIQKSIKLSLLMLRNHSRLTTETASAGFFQRPVETGRACQLIRVTLPHDAACYPEISGGKHRFTIRFMQQATTARRPVQSTQDIEFELHCSIV